MIEMLVERKQREAVDIVSFDLVARNGSQLPPYRAGAHVDVVGPNGHVRQYSLCGDPADHTRYRIAILNDACSRGGSASMHEHVHEGDILQISEPRNCFPLNPDMGKSVLIAGGIGITPIIAMARELASDDIDFELHYCVRSAERAAFAETIERLGLRAQTRFYFDDAGPRLNLIELISENEGECCFYVCGPAGLIRMVRETAAERGLNPDRVRFECFAAQAAMGIEEIGFEVMVSSTGRAYAVPPNGTITATLAAHGIEIPVSCEQGICGTCVTKIISGEPDHRDSFLTEEEHRSGTVFTPCCSRAKSSRLVIDV